MGAILRVIVVPMSILALGVVIGLAAGSLRAPAAQLPATETTERTLREATPGKAPTIRPVVYIASPYTRGDAAINTHFQCRIWDQLMTDGKVWPIAPLWSHFQHTIYPRNYEDWIAYDLALIPRYDACLRLNAEHTPLNYSESNSTGADKEVAEFQRLGKPVFYSFEELYAWVESGKK